MNQARKNRNTMAAWLLLLPSFFGLVLFNLVPMGYSVWISLTDWNGISELPKFTGLSNYLGVWSEELSRNSFLTTFKFIGLYVPAVVLASLVLSMMIHSLRRGRKAYRAIVFIPVILSWVTVSFIWRWIYDPNGLLNYALSLVGVQGPMWLGEESTALGSIVVASIWKDLGLLTVILMAGLDNIPDSYHEAAMIDGATFLQRFRHITMPMLTPSLFFVIVITLINNCQIFDQMYIMTGGGPLNSTRTVVLDIYENAFSYNRVGYASAQAITLFLIILAVTVVQNVLQKRWVVDEAE